MVQIIEESPGLAARFAQGLGKGLSGESNSLVKQYADMVQQRRGQETLGRLLAGEELSQEDWASLPMQMQIEAKKAMTPKAPAGGLTGQPVPKDVSNRINKIINDNPEATSEELALAFDDDEIPRAYSNSYIETRRRQDEAGAKLGAKKEDQSLKEKQFFHKESEAYDKKLIENYQTSQKQLEAIKEIESAVGSGNVKPLNIANLVSFIPKIGDKLSTALKNKEQVNLETNLPELIEGWKEVFGVRLSDADLKIIKDKLPDIFRSPEANKEIARIFKKYGAMSKIRFDIGSKLKKENKGYRTSEYPNEVERLFTKQMEEQRMINDQDDEIAVPFYEIEKAKKAGYKLKNG